MVFQMDMPSLYNLGMKFIHYEYSLLKALFGHKVSNLEVKLRYKDDKKEKMV